MIPVKLTYDSKSYTIYMPAKDKNNKSKIIEAFKSHLKITENRKFQYGFLTPLPVKKAKKKYKIIPIEGAYFPNYLRPQA